MTEITKNSLTRCCRCIGACAAMIVVCSVVAFADTPMTTAPDMSASPGFGNNIDYTALVNPVFSQYDLQRAKALGLNDHQLARIMAIAVLANKPAGRLLDEVADGDTIPMIATRYGVPFSRMNEEKYVGRLENLRMAYATTGADRRKSMTAGWVGTIGASAATNANLLETARSAGNFTMFLRLVRTAGLDSILRGPGPYTVLAPTDAAFSALPADQLNALLTDNAKLTRVLEYHIINGRYTSADVMGQMSPTTPMTLEGQPLTVGTSGGLVTVNGAHAVVVDLIASNGVLYGIDTVLMPPM